MKTLRWAWQFLWSRPLAAALNLPEGSYRLQNKP